MPITVVGLGPGDPDLLTTGAVRTLSAAATVWLRTARHPVQPFLPHGPEYRSFDEMYDTLDTFEAVYAAIVEQLIADEAEHGETVYAGPGDPLIAEATVRELLRRAAKGGPAVSRSGSPGPSPTTVIVMRRLRSRSRGARRCSAAVIG